MPLYPWSRFLKVALLDNDVLVEFPAGDMDEVSRYWLNRLAQDLAGQQVWLDLEKVRCLKREGVEMILGLHAEIAARGGSLTLFNTPPHIRAVFNETLTAG